MSERPHKLRIYIDVSDPWARRVLRDALGARTDIQFVRAPADADVRVGDQAGVHDARSDAEPSRVLTEREREVLQALSEGLGNGAIAQRLGISTSTVKFHLASLFEKLGVHRRAEAVAMGIRHGDVLL